MAAVKSYGFGVVPARSAHHFFVVLPSLVGNPQVRVYERFHWSSTQNESSRIRDAELGPDLSPVYKHGQRIEGADMLRLEIPVGKWEKVVKAVTSEFNARLRKNGMATGRFSAGGMAVSEDLGKELMVLLWAIKDSDPGQIAAAIENWLGFQPEERCWLYTMTNTRHGGLDDRNGWRAALREILCAQVEDNQAEINPLLVTDVELNGDRSPPDRSLSPCNRKPFGAVESTGFFLVLPMRGERFFPYVYESSLDRKVARVPLYQWNEVAHDVEDVFNIRLAEDKLAKGKFSAGVNALSRLFGKELLILLWTLELIPKSSAPIALRNWKALMPEERWWLYTRTSASAKNWKKALRSALAECGPMAIQGGLF